MKTDIYPLKKWLSKHFLFCGFITKIEWITKWINETLSGKNTCDFKSNFSRYHDFTVQLKAEWKENTKMNIFHDMSHGWHWWGHFVQNIGTVYAKSFFTISLHRQRSFPNGFLEPISLTLFQARSKSPKYGEAPQQKFFAL